MINEFKPESSWTACTKECQHRGPYRVSERGSINPNNTFLVGKYGVPVNFAFTDTPYPILITAPHPHPNEDE